MLLQNRCRMHGIDGQRDGGSYCRRLSSVRRNAEDFATLEDLSDRHRNRLSWNRINVVEPTFTNLLLATSFVQINNNVRFFGNEIRRRIIEREMSIFTDTDKGDINCLWRYEPANTTTFCMNVIGLSVDEVEGARVHAADDPLFQISPKTRGMGFR